MFLIILGTVLSFLASAYTIVLIARVILDWTRIFAPRWRPSGPILVLANGIYALTDPPLRWLRKFIPPLRLGNIALDVGFIVLFVAVTMVARVAPVLIAMGR